MYTYSYSLQFVKFFNYKKYVKYFCILKIYPFPHKITLGDSWTGKLDLDFELRDYSSSLFRLELLFVHTKTALTKPYPRPVRPTDV
jgi:hypothetical protein